MTNILGISAYYHDSAACLVRDGEIIAAAQEERFTARSTTRSSPSRGRLLPARGRPPASTSSTTSASTTSRSSSSSASRELSRRGPQGPPLVPDGDAGVAEGKALHRRRHPARARGYEGSSCSRNITSRTRRARSIHRPSRSPPFSHGRRRRVGTSSTASDAARISISSPRSTTALARHAVLGLHLLHRLQSQLGEYKVMGLAPTASHASSTAFSIRCCS